MPYYMFYATWNHSQPPTTMRDLAHNNVTSRRQGPATPPRTCHGPATDPNPRVGSLTPGPLAHQLQNIGGGVRGSFFLFAVPMLI